MIARIEIPVTSGTNCAQPTAKYGYRIFPEKDEDILWRISYRE